VICDLHPSLGEQEVCEACKVGLPPDLGIMVKDDTETTEALS